MPIKNVTKPGNTPLKKMHGSFGVKILWMKDETENPTHTFKDRLAYEMIRPLHEQLLAGEKPTRTTFASISYGNTAKAMGHYVRQFNKIAGSEVTRAVAFIPPTLEKRTFGPDTNGGTLSAKKILKDLARTCRLVTIDLKAKIWRMKDLKEKALKEGVLLGEFIDITEGLNRPAYVNIIIEAIEQQLQCSPDYVIVPFGAGILCNEVIDYINDHHLHTRVIPVSSGDPNTIAIMLYGPIWVDTESLMKKGWGWTRHEKIDRKGRVRKPYKVYHVTDDEIRSAMSVLKGRGLHAEPSGASGFAILSRLQAIDRSFNPRRHSVLVINTGDGLLN